MSRLRSFKATYGFLAALSSLAVAACGGSGSTTTDTSKAPKQPVSSGYASSTNPSNAVSIGTSVHVTNTPTKTFRVKPVDTTESVVVGPTGYPVYTFQGETTHHIICKKTSSTSTNCWAFWPPVSVNSAKGLSAQAGVTGKLGTFRNHGTLQLTLNGDPLYYFTPDIMSGKKSAASGAELKTFGSTWLIVTPGSSKH
jgi:predicted lipoprotein with Yx(FWY)xxD motif